MHKGLYRHAFSLGLLLAALSAPAWASSANGGTSLVISCAATSSRLSFLPICQPNMSVSASEMPLIQGSAGPSNSGPSPIGGGQGGCIGPCTRPHDHYPGPFQIISAQIMQSFIYSSKATLNGNGEVHEGDVSLAPGSLAPGVLALRNETGLNEAVNNGNALEIENGYGRVLESSAMDAITALNNAAAQKLTSTGNIGLIFDISLPSFANLITISATSGLNNAGNNALNVAGQINYGGFGGGGI